MRRFSPKDRRIEFFNSHSNIPKVLLSADGGIGLSLPRLQVPDVKCPPLISDKEQRRHHSIDEIANALRRAHGYRSVAASLLGITLRALNSRISESPDLQAILQDISDELLDRAEFRLLERIAADDVTAIKFYLRCKGCSRGWSEASANDSCLNDEHGALSHPDVIFISEPVLRC